jgi:hypothetical protein
MIQVTIGLRTKESEFVNQMRQKMSKTAVRAGAKDIGGSKQLQGEESGLSGPGDVRLLELQTPSRAGLITDRQTTEAAWAARIDAVDTAYFTFLLRQRIKWQRWDSKIKSWVFLVRLKRKADSLPEDCNGFFRRRCWIICNCLMITAVLAALMYTVGLEHEQARECDKAE